VWRRELADRGDRGHQLPAGYDGRSRRELDALHSLVAPGLAIVVRKGGYVNGAASGPNPASGMTPTHAIAHESAPSGALLPMTPTHTWVVPIT
jgi:hypothetical protein